MEVLNFESEELPELLQKAKEKIIADKLVKLAASNISIITQ